MSLGTTLNCFRASCKDNKISNKTNKSGMDLSNTKYKIKIDLISLILKFQTHGRITTTHRSSPSNYENENPTHAPQNVWKLEKKYQQGYVPLIKKILK
jgi:hypothetical protein